MSGELLKAHHEILSDTSDGKLTAEEVYNLETYGAKHPSEFDTGENELQPGECICGEFNCKEEYVHWTSGW